MPYNPTTGTVTLGDNDFAVPGASGCTTFPVNVNNEINSQMGLPSPAGNNAGVFTATSSPVLGRALVASFTATPSNGAGAAERELRRLGHLPHAPDHELPVGLRRQRLLRPDDGGPTTSTTYATPGTRTIKLRVTDADGDPSETTRTVTTLSGPPDLRISKSHTGDFLTARSALTRINVTNVGVSGRHGPDHGDGHASGGFASTASPARAGTALPSGQDVICTTDEDLAAGGGAAAPLTIDVIAVGRRDVHQRCDGRWAGDGNASNDTAEDPTRVIQAGIDVAPVKSLEEETHIRGERSHYRIAVSNVGTATAVDRIRVFDPIPAGLTFVSASGGLDWVCNFTSGEVRCFSDQDLDPGRGAPRHRRDGRGRFGCSELDRQHGDHDRER